MSHRVEVGIKSHLFDARGERVRHQILQAFPENKSIKKVKCLDIYNIDADEIESSSCKEAFCDPVIQDIAIDAVLPNQCDWYIEVGYKPGVTDNVGHSASYALGLITGRQIPVYSAKGFLLRCDLDHEEIQSIASECLANELIQYFRIFAASELARGIEPFIPKVKGSSVPDMETISLDIPDDSLKEMSGSRTLALNLEEMKSIQSYFRDDKVLATRREHGLDDNITDVELEALAQTWSEHCKHKIFNADITYIENGKEENISSLFKTYIMESTRVIREQKGDDDICVSVFTDNAGVIRFDEKSNIVFKVETHNSPSALDPYGGALTGIVGVNRDPFGTGIGAKLIFNTDVFCFADPFYKKTLPPKILHPKRIFDGVREGVEHGGNKSGVPTVNGCLVFDERFLGKPLVYCGTAGIMPRFIGDIPSHEKHILPGDLIVMSGGKIGKDGIHGATFSSEELNESSPTSAVQIGDPITQKKLTDFLLKARDLGLYRGITDNGAGGLSSSIGEMAELSGGCVINLETPPLKYQGLSAWEILLSEAQERMSLAVDPSKIEEFLCLSDKMGVESTVIGNFTDNGYFHCTYEGKTVAYLDLEFMHNGLPKMQLVARWDDKPEEDVKTPVPADQNTLLLEMLGRLNICSKEYVVRQYDHEVQGGSVVKPLTGIECDGPSDAGVIRPDLETMEGVVVSNGIIPRYSDIDTYDMTACALDEALRNYVCVGGNPYHWACLDNFCWCDPVAGPKNPDGEHKLAQLVRANKALYDYTIAYGCPLVSGKDSMKNDYLVGDLKISIPPTILISVIGKIDDVTKAVTMDTKHQDDLVYVLGKTKRELGGSEYFESIDLKGHKAPKVDAASALERYSRLHRAIEEGIICSAHDISDGGLAVALAETAFSGGLGIETELSCVSCSERLSDTEILYSETQSRIIVTVSKENAPRIENIFGEDASLIGTVTKSKRLVVIGTDESTIIDSDIEDMKQAWKATLGFE